ncbi:MAG: acyltransferase [Pseudomonadota bacterium]|nr:acyltransferase [Pseudomonadota bacterium]MEC7465384.1 acyltransferase [Pseudomonadota bacterium]MEC7786882.1 acyltransferase [Pseudomonadota bacterium]MEC8108399.1 acyltransferase [Pseudomonadota bacterium]MEC8378357.1 acyltransferase [Pseudomonadota bacterium]
MKRINWWLDQKYIKFKIAPQFEKIGEGPLILGVRYLHVNGEGISVGNFATFISAPDSHIHLTTWNADTYQGKIEIGDFCLFSPGVRISAATRIKIGNSCMFANSAYISDSDWHGIYDRALPVGKSEEVVLEDNVWIGDGAIVSKGVTIGKNSIVGARSVVIKDVPENVIVAGNPAQVVKELDENERLISRADMFSSPDELDALYLKIDRISLKENSFLGWIKSKLFPGKNN